VVSKDAQGLMAALGAAIGAGTDPETAMTAAGVGIARAAIRATGTEGAMVRFVPDEPQGSVMTLPGRLPRLLAAAARKERPAPAIRSMLGGRRKSSIQARFPDDAPESQWGLPPTALRLLRDGARVDTLGELLGAARGGETDEVWAAVDLLLCLGLLELGESIGGTGRIVEPERDDIEIETIDAAAEESDGGAEQGDEEANSLRAWFEEHRTSDPWVVLGIDDSEQMTSEGVEAAFRAQSANFHPDIYLTASKPAQALARRCFARLGLAKEALADVDVLLEARQRMRAAEEGRPYASAAEQQRARLIAKRADVAARKKQWGEAHKLWMEAKQVDPTEVSYEWFALKTGWQSGDIEGAQAEAAMLELKSMKMGQRADLMATVGEIRLRAGDENGAYAAFEQAIEINPEHVDARRRMRLRDMRQSKSEPPARSGLSLKGLFSFGKKSDDSRGRSEK
ncbi:MAG: hypothetical protein VX265_01695, partial [Myxococcota bacterium]|nr:hypothetical protein [Myxococcota bacterium]